MATPGRVARVWEKNVAEKGDTVEITTCRRISRTKTYRLLRVIKKASMTEQAQ